MPANDKCTVHLNSNLDCDFAKIFIYKETDKRITSTSAVMDGEAVTFRIRDVNIRERRMGGMEGSCRVVYVCYLQFVWTELRTQTTSEEHVITLISLCVCPFLNILCMKLKQ